MNVTLLPENQFCEAPIQLPEYKRGKKKLAPIICDSCKCAVDKETVNLYLDIVNYTKIKFKYLQEEDPCILYWLIKSTRFV